MIEKDVRPSLASLSCVMHDYVVVQPYTSTRLTTSFGGQLRSWRVNILKKTIHNVIIYTVL